MSATAEPTLSPADAEAVIYREIFVPAFIDKMASHGVQIASEEELGEYLSIGRRLLVADQQNQFQQTGNRVSILKQASQSLDAEMHRRYGIAPANNPDEIYVKEASDTLAARPDVQKVFETYYAGLQSN